MSQIKAADAIANAGYTGRYVPGAKSAATNRWSFGNLIVWSAFFVLIVAFIVHHASEQRVDL